MLDLKELEKYANKIDHYIRTATDVVEGLKIVKASLDEARLSQEHSYQQELAKMREDFGFLVRQLELNGMRKINPYEAQMNYVKDKLATDDWPIAVDPRFIHPDEAERAEQILDFVVTEFFEGLKFLDYKCNTGHIVNKASLRGAANSVGFDENLKNCHFTNKPGLTFTSKIDEVKEQGPYDVILLYDVIDHVEDPIGVLATVKKLISKNGRIYVRCHPWCSRHGAHLHDQINKAYIHLILDEVELTRVGGYVCKWTNKLTRPIETYRSWFVQAGLKIDQELPIEENMENFFDDVILMDRLEQHWKDDCVKSYTAIQFVDYMLSPIDLNKKVF